MEFSKSDIWYFQDAIKYKKVKFSKGDDVFIFCKTHNMYPRFLNVGDFGIIKTVELDHIIVDFSKCVLGRDFPTRINPKNIKLPKKIFISKVSMRELKISKLLS